MTCYLPPLDILPAYKFLSERSTKIRVAELSKQRKNRNWNPSVVVYPPAASFLEEYSDWLSFAGTDAKCL
jgi:hypothetical protein